MHGAEFKLSTVAGDSVGLEWGAPSGRPTLAIHGWLDHADSFRNLAELLDPSIRVLALDLPGHGKARHCAKDARYHLMDWVCEVDAVVNCLGWKKFDFVTHSLGGAIGLFYAAIRPERVDKIVLFDSVGPMNVEPDELVQKVRSHFEQLDEVRVSTRGLPLEALIEVRKKSTFTITGARLSSEVAEILVRRAFSETPQGWVPSFDSRVKLSSVQSFTLAQILAFISEVRAHVLFFRASEGILRARYGWDERVSALKNVKSQAVPGDHYFHLSNAASISREINQFLLS